MKKVTSLLLGLIISSAAVAAEVNLQERIRHMVTLVGLQSGEGRYIRGEVFENNQFKSGYYFCAGANHPVYDLEYFFTRSQTPFHEEHLIRFSICQDATLAHCQEFATDKYQTFRNLDGYLENNVSKTNVDVSPVKFAFQACDPDVDLDETVQKSIHIDDRRFAHLG